MCPSDGHPPSPDSAVRPLLQAKADGSLAPAYGVGTWTQTTFPLARASSMACRVPLVPAQMLGLVIDLDPLGRPPAGLHQRRDQRRPVLEPGLDVAVRRSSLRSPTPTQGATVRPIATTRVAPSDGNPPRTEKNANICTTSGWPSGIAQMSRAQPCLPRQTSALSTPACSRSARPALNAKTGAFEASTTSTPGGPSTNKPAIRSAGRSSLLGGTWSCLRTRSSPVQTHPDRQWPPDQRNPDRQPEGPADALPAPLQARPVPDHPRGAALRTRRLGGRAQPLKRSDKSHTQNLCRAVFTQKADPGWRARDQPNIGLRSVAISKIDCVLSSVCPSGKAW